MPAATPQGKLQNDGNCSVPNTAGCKQTNKCEDQELS